MDIQQLTKEIAEKAWSHGRSAALHKIQAELYDWLSELKFPGNNSASSWEEAVIEYEITPEDLEAKEGVRVRFAIKLYTQENQYLISILESLNPIDAGNFILTVHVNWQALELRKRQVLEETYGANFDGNLKPKHTLWAQSFIEGELAPALCAGAVAILGHELKPAPPKEKIGQMVQPVTNQVPSFPKADQD